MNISAIEALAFAYIIIVILYELILRQELQYKPKVISTFTYITFGFVAKPMFKIMSFQFWGHSKKLNIVGSLFSVLHYLIFIQMGFGIFNSGA